MSKGIQIIKENNNLTEWSRQVEECRNSGQSVRSWCEQHQRAVSTFHYRQQTVWKAMQKSNQFVEVPLSFNENHNTNIAVLVKVGSICIEVHNGADSASAFRTRIAAFLVAYRCGHWRGIIIIRKYSFIDYFFIWG